MLLVLMHHVHAQASWLSFTSIVSCRILLEAVSFDILQVESSVFKQSMLSLLS